MKLHIIGLPHSITTEQFQTCAFTQKIWKFCKMMPPLGWEVIHYGVEGADVPTRKVDLVSREEWDKYYDITDQKGFYNKSPNDFVARYNLLAVAALMATSSEDDAILFPYGQREIGSKLTNRRLQVESGIGYEATFAPYKVFESHAWANRIYSHLGIDDGPHFDAVIPNYFDPDKLPLGKHQGDYFLYMGRLVPRKGVAIAAEVCKKLGKKLVIAGQGTLASANITDSSGIEFLGPVNDPVKKAELLGDALALFSPTQYFEPFGGVTIEAAMCGTPSITSAHGCYPETIVQGVTGWRCQLYDDYMQAAQRLDGFEPERIRKYAVANYSMERIAPLYDIYFKRLSLANQPEGWIKPNPVNKEELYWWDTIAA
jgi:glycosyltransferase involved in cell wall biosynthesis